MSMSIFDRRADPFTIPRSDLDTTGLFKIVYRIPEALIIVPNLMSYALLGIVDLLTMLLVRFVLDLVAHLIEWQCRRCLRRSQ